MDPRITTDINDGDFFSDENFAAFAEEYGEPASYADWAPTAEEIQKGVVTKPRPAGDMSALPFGDGVETIKYEGEAE